MCICMHIHHIHIHICGQPAAGVFADVYVGVKTHLCNIHTCSCTTAQNTCKVHASLTAKNAHIYIPSHIYIRIHMHTNAHTHTWHCPHTEALILRPTIYAQIRIHIHIHMCIHTQMHTYTYIHSHIYTHTYKMYTWTHASTPGMTASQWTREELLQTQEALHVSFVRLNQTTFRTHNARTSLCPLPETPTPLQPPSPLPNIPQNSSQTAGKLRLSNCTLPFVSSGETVWLYIGETKNPNLRLRSQ